MTDYHYLCMNCGKISPFADWKLIKWDDECERLVPVEPGDGDPICVCPRCNWHHEDTDSNPGICDGTLLEMKRQRRTLVDDWLDIWADPLTGGMLL